MRVLSYIFIFIAFILNISSAAELKFTLTGKDEYPFFEEYEKDKMFMLYKNEAQFTTNSTLFGTHNAAATIEMIDGQQTQNLFGIFTDSYGNKGYVKSIPTTKKKIKGNMLNKKIGTSIGSFKNLGGEGPWKYLKGTVSTGVYYSMGNGHFIWQGSIKNLPDDIFKKIDGYIHTKKKNSN